MDRCSHEAQCQLYKNQIQTVRSMCSNIPQVPTSIKDFQLMEFLYCCDMDIEETIKCIRNHYVMKSKLMSLFQNRDPSASELQHVWDVAYSFPLPRLTGDGWGIMFFGLKESVDPNGFDFVRSAKLSLMVIEATVAADPACRSHVVILDTKGLKLSHFPLSYLVVAKRLLSFLQNGIQTKLERVHLINCSSVVYRLFLFFKPLMSVRLLNLLRFHSNDLAVLYSDIPRELLPNEIGGSLGSSEEFNDMMKRKLSEMKQFFQEEERQRQISVS